MDQRKLRILFVLIFVVMLAIPLAFTEPHRESGAATFQEQLKFAPAKPRGYPNETLLKAAVFAGFVKPTDLASADILPAGCRRELDVVYGRLEERELKLDLYFPAEENSGELRPALLFLHGGGWKGGKKQDVRYYCNHYAARGFVTATAEYRLRDEAPFPAPLQDVQCALRYLHANAERLRIDPERIGIVGHSAGGHLALLAAYAKPEAFPKTGGCDDASSSVRCVVNFYGPVDLAQPFGQHHPLVEGLLGTTWEQNREAFDLASPLYHLDAGDPPTLAFHGTIDSIVPERQARLLQMRLGELGIDHHYDCLPGWPHAMDLAAAVNLRAEYVMDCFFEWQMPPFKRPENPLKN